MSGESKTSPRRLRAADRQLRALELRKAGVSFDRIAQEVGYANRNGAHAAVQAALKATLTEPADEVRVLQLERLDRMLLAVWQKAIGGDLLAVASVLKIEERRAKLLGLDTSDMVDILERVSTIAEALGLDKVAAVDEAMRILHERKAGHATPAL